MAQSNFPLRWESTGDKWWYACPIDYAAANGHYDLVRELLRIDGNHLMNLTSLRRVRRLELVWDNEKEFNHVAKCRCKVAQQLFDECNSENDGENSLIKGGYGGWLLYTAAFAGDLGFVEMILRKYPFLVFGEGEYGLTDVFYAAARSKNDEVFRVVYGFASKPRFVGEECVEDVPLGFKDEIKKRGIHACARGGNLIGLKWLLDGCCDDDVLECRDVHGSTILHAASGKGQLEVVKHLIASYDMITSVDDKGNTPLHVAAYKSQLSVLEALIQASPSSPLILNEVGDTFLHMAVAGFQTPGFRRLDQQIELMKQLVRNDSFNLEDIINSKNNEGRTALHLAIIGNVHSNLVELLMTARFIDLNIRDNHGLTPLDYLKRQPRSASSEILIRQLISAGGISSCKDFAVRRAFASQLKLQGVLGSPGTSFRVSDNELFLFTGMDHLLDSRLGKGHVSAGHFRSISSISQCDSTNGTHFTRDNKKSSPLGNAAKRFKSMFHWPSKKGKETVQSRKATRDDFSDKRWSTSEETPVTLRERYSNASSLPSNKRTLAVRSNISSPTNRKKFAPGLAHDVLHDQFVSKIRGRSRSSSFSSMPSPKSLDKGKGIWMEHETSQQPSKQVNGDDTQHVVQKQESKAKRFINPALCFGGSRLGKHSNKQPALSVA